MFWRIIGALGLSVGLAASLQATVADAQTRIALVQYDADSHFDDYEHNLFELTRYAEEAVRAGAALIAFPEGSTHGYVGTDTTYCRPGRRSCYERTCLDVTTVAENATTGPTTRHWLAFAAQHDVYIVYHLIESHEGVFHNSTAIVGPEGFLGVYRKRILYGPDYCYAEPGQEPLTVDTSIGRFGFLICADANHDGYFARYRNQSVDAVFVPMAWDQSPHGSRAARVFFQAVARRNGIDIFGIDQPAWDGTGYYPADGNERIRQGLPPVGIDVEGISYHDLDLSW